MNKKIFSLIGTGLTFLSLILWFLVPAMKYNGIIKFEFSFLDLTFGKSMSVLGESVKVWNFSVFNLITLVLILVTLALLIINVLDIEIHQVVSKFKNLITACFALLSGIFVLLVKVFSVTTGDSKDGLVLATGSIIIFILLLLTALNSLFIEYGYDKIIEKKD